MYPLPYQAVIEREARARGLDPYFVAALIRQESRFNRNAKSGAGAVGLMQVMPATGKRLGASVGSLTDAETNIKLGTRFLGDLIRMYDERLDLVLAAYNAGPSRANRWRSFPEFAAQDLFVERIPFEETRDYVKVVQLNAAIYRAIYGAQSGQRDTERAQR
jgi:soluble lytic murein transglycosylase